MVDATDTTASGGSKKHNLAAFPDGREDARPLEETAQAMDLDVSSYVGWIRAERWDWMVYGRRQREVGHRFWYNTYWKTELAKQAPSDDS